MAIKSLNNKRLQFQQWISIDSVNQAVKGSDLIVEELRQSFFRFNVPTEYTAKFNLLPNI